MAEQEPHIGKSPEKTPFELAVEKSIGESIENIRGTFIDHRRQKIEKKLGTSLRVVSQWSFIGSEKPLDGIISRQQVDALVAEAIE